MACKIILFVSSVDPNKPKKVEDYTCPNGNTVSGAQTNEAPAKYLLEKFGNVSQLLGIVTPESAPAWEYLTGTLSDFCAARGLAVPEFISIPLQEEQAFAQEVLPELLANISSGDTLLLETTGGFRNAVMYLLLLSRILSYTGIPVTEAVYSHYQSHKITSVSQIFSMFQLAEGMQNLSAFGSVETLRAYYAGRPQPAGVDALLSAMERLTEAIALCRTRQIDDCMNQFNAALAQLEGTDQTDPLLQELLPVFRSKFGRDGRMTIPTLIRWCADNGMLQQALTVYTEQMPVYLLSPDGLIPLNESRVKPPDPPTKSYESQEVAYFLRRFLYLSRSRNPYLNTLRNMEQLLPRSGWHLRCSPASAKTLTADYIYIKLLRNMTNHANDASQRNQQETLRYLYRLGYPQVDNISASDVKQVLHNALEHLRQAEDERGG